MLTDPMEGYNQNKNFWNSYPSFRTIKEFDDLYKRDKTKSKAKSSLIMWGTALCVSRKHSPMYNLPDKWELVKKDIIKDSKFNWDDYNDVVYKFKEVVLTQSERSLMALEELMYKRDRYLKKMDYYFDTVAYDEESGKSKLIKGTAKQIDEAFKASAQIYKDLDRIQKQINEEDIKKSSSNKEQSLSEKNEI